MHLDRKITLYQPGQVTRDAEGNRTRGHPVAMEVFARRIAKQGTEGITLDIALQSQPVDYMIRYSPMVAGIDRDWYLEEDGVEYRIESVHEPAIGRKQFLVIRSVARV